MGKFIKLKKGLIIRIHYISDRNGDIYGWNVVSKNLRIKVYNKRQLEHAPPTPQEVQQMIRQEEYYNLEEDNKFHSSFTTRERYREISNFKKSQEKLSA